MKLEDLAQLRDKHLELQKTSRLLSRNRYDTKHFIYPPKSFEFSEKLGAYLNFSKEADAYEMKLQQKWEVRFQSNDPAVANKALKELMDKIKFEQKTLEESPLSLDFPLPRINSLEQFTHFIYSLYREEINFRMGIYVLHTTVTKALNQLEIRQKQLADDADPALQMQLDGYFDSLNKAHEALSKRINDYPLIKITIENYITELMRSVQSKFEEALAKLKLKIDDLSLKNSKGDENYSRVSQEGQTLYKELLARSKCFFENGSLEKINVFKQDCLGYIQAAKSEFKNHRGWAEDLNNFTYVLLSMLSFFIVNTVSYCATGQFRFLPKPKTDSLVKLEQFKSSVQELTPGI
nr:hypothetical protein [Legionella jordanis]